MTERTHYTTGRLNKSLPHHLQELVYPTGNEAAKVKECDLYAKIDRAHISMLLKCGLVTHDWAKDHLEKIADLEREQYASLLSMSTPRGFYMLWENYLEEEDTSFAHLGRSRNDLNATLARLQMRTAIHDVLMEGLDIIELIQSMAHVNTKTTMAGYTHGQPAMPITFGHQLLAWGFAISREMNVVLQALNNNEAACPLGAGAQGGTNLPIDAAYTAQLLGFERAAFNSLDAVADRSFLIHAAAAASGLACVISRVCQDLLFYASPQVNYVYFDDELCGASSMMPHKRNPYLCEIVAGKMNSIIGKWNYAITTLSGTPYSNTARATEVLQEVLDGLEKTRKGLILFSAILNGLHPNFEKMLATAEDYYTCSTALANELVTKAGYAFRQAHRLVGEWVSKAENHRQSFAEIVQSECRERGININFGILSPDNAMLAAEYGGGPGTMSVEFQTKQLNTKRLGIKNEVTAHTTRWKAADELLEETVSRVCN